MVKSTAGHIPSCFEISELDKSHFPAGEYLGEFETIFKTALDEEQSRSVGDF
jgi:hypothetical protein